MTLNVWNVFGPWARRRDEIAAWLTRLRPDAACLQEVWRDAEVDQLEEILQAAEGCGQRFSAVRADRPFDGGFLGNAVLTRAPPSDRVVVPLPVEEPGEAVRLLVGARLSQMWVLSTHLSPHPRQQSLRWRQLELLGEVIERLARPARDVAVVLGGDFNAPSHAREMRAFARRTDTLLVDAWRQAGDGSAGYTWSPGNPFTRGTEMPSGRLDYVFVAAGAARERVVRARIVCDQSITGVLASDHYGVVAELARSEAAPAGPSWSDEK